MPSSARQGYQTFTDQVSRMSDEEIKKALAMHYRCIIPQDDDDPTLVYDTSQWDDLSSTELKRVLKSTRSPR